MLERWAAAALAAGRYEEAAAELARLVQTQPLREHAWGQLMRALYRAGRQGEALAAYRLSYRIFDQELGVVPGKALQELHQQILSRDPGLDDRSTPDAHSAPETVPGSRPVADGTDGARRSRTDTPGKATPPVPAQLPAAGYVFVGRRAELARLHRILAETADQPTAVPIVAVSAPRALARAPWRCIGHTRLPTGSPTGSCT